MNFGFTEEQELLRSEVRKFLDENAPMEKVREWTEAGAGCPQEVWGQLAELGWLGLTIPEEHGGAGLDFVTLMVLLEETGRSLFPSPLISTVIAAQAIERSGSAAQHQRWLPGLADGSRVGALALLEESDTLSPGGIALEGKEDGDTIRLSGVKRYVPDAGCADLFVVAFRSGDGAEEISLAVVEKDRPGVIAEDHQGIDLTKRIGVLELRDVEISRAEVLGSVGEGWTSLAWLLDVGAALVTAEMVGAAEGALRLVTDFAREREQFGSPIGRYQGVKHPLAEMYVDLESFKSLVYFAAWSLDEEQAGASLAVSRAKAFASEAFARLGIDGVQLHGGVGYTWEYDIQLYLKRSKWARPAFGDADHHYARIAEIGGA